ncbi:uncharacterized protein BDR25DRAFT_272383 [Lindgomyces ingoldianus]|uniref:Uncharacterized protein n=1 Tax=Lindgomyces ingoldianus TaxID=673940 RepID=A0ACB6QC44_9PLEO|nr:uncharacterized protein BDR25DRAFT_272383 [Lindgomyces ingoldianus]KAF2463947.1 hypothetical protein BDR25DRAFT_272383 [Lindgomyces ingoldianus]
MDDINCATTKIPDFWTPVSDPASRDSSTHFPLDDINLDTVSNETLIALLETAPILHKLGGTAVVRLSQNLVLKGGTSVLPSEAENMKLVAESTNIRLPTVYRSFNTADPNGGYYQTRGYIVMDYIHGDCLADRWAHLTHDQRENVVFQIANMVNQLQSHPLDFAGPVGGGPCQGMWFSDYGAGPFKNCDAIEEWFNHKLSVCKRFRQIPDSAPPFVFKRFVFTHQDITPRNIVIDPLGQAWLIDWAFSGSYPEVFEAAAIARQHQFQDFGQLLLQHIPFEAEKVVQLKSIIYGLTTAALA